MIKFGRSARVEVLNPSRRTVVESMAGSGLHIEFDVRKTLKPEANTGLITITNLSQATREKISDVVRRKLEVGAEDIASLAADLDADISKGADAALIGGTVWQNIFKAERGPIELVYDNLGIAYIRLSVGYSPVPNAPGLLGVLIEGDSRNIRHYRERTDWKTQIEIGDAETVLREAFLSKSYGPNSKVIDIIADLVKSIGGTVSPLQKQLLAEKLGTRTILPSGWAASGNSFSYLQQFLYYLDIEWSMQDGEFVLLNNDGISLATLPEPPLLISQADGMVGIPRRLEDDGVEVAILCDPTARPGRAVTLAALQIAGSYRIEQVRHTGSTRQGPWYSIIELRQLSALGEVG